MKTLGDYRKEVAASLKSENHTLCDTIRTAFEDYKNLLQIVLADTPEDRWNRRGEVETRAGLLLSIKVLEFAVTYKDVGSIYELCPDWPVHHVDKNLSLIPSDGPQSYGDAVFRGMRNDGRDIILCVQRARNHHIKSSHVMYRPFMFLVKHPEVNELMIDPEPDEIMKTMFDHTVNGFRKWLSVDGLSPSKVNSEFAIVCQRLRDEWRSTQEPPAAEPGAGGGGGGRREEDEHTWCQLALSKRDIGIALGLPDDRDVAKNLNALVEDQGIVLRPHTRSKQFVALDTLSPVYRVRFTAHLRDHFKVTV